MKISRVIPIFGIIILIYIIYDIGLNEIINSFLSIPPIVILFASFFTLPRILFASLKWWYICKKQKIDVSFVYIIKILLVCIFYGIITPAAIGSFISIYYIKIKSRISCEKSITNSLLDSASEFISMVLLALIGSALIIENYPGVFYTILFVFIVCIIFFKLILNASSSFDAINIR